MGSPNFSPGHSSRKAIVVHTMSGSLAGSDSWFKNPASQVSAHFGVGLDGTVHQYVDLFNSAFANGILEPGNAWVPHFGSAWANGDTASIETEDLGHADQPVTDAQYASVLAVCRLILAANPTIHTLATHRSISPASRASCPGDRWWGRSQRFQSLAANLGLATLL